MVLKIQRKCVKRHAPEKFRDFREPGPWAQLFVQRTNNFSSERQFRARFLSQHVQRLPP